MASSVATRRDGDAYQARIFWRKAVCLLDPASPIIRVGFESGPKGFDDVWVEYLPDRAPGDPYGRRLLREHFQCKWHVSIGDFGYIDLTLPEWINAHQVSLLQRARQAQLLHARAGEGARFKLVTNWQVAKGDVLRELVHQKSKNLRLDRLFDGTTDVSKTGKVRKAWRDHLGIEDDELQILAKTLVIDTDGTSLEDHRDNLDSLFFKLGLVRIPAHQPVFVYDDLPYQWLSQGRLEFDRDTFRDACRHAGLLDAAAGSAFAPVFGVKSFEHAIDRLEDRCTKVLDLVGSFDDRQIKDQKQWSATLYPKLREFLHAAAKDNEHLRLILDAHVTLAFAAGSVLNIKSGRMVEVEQRTFNRAVWHAQDMDPDPAWPIWDFKVERLTDVDGDLAVAVSLTHDVVPAVRAHLKEKLPNVSHLLTATPNCRPGARTVACGRHAFMLAESLAQEVPRHRGADMPLLHLFIAAPNAFAFFLGQRQPGMGRTTLYEFDFEGAAGGGYAPAISLPI